jgi:hypothetical protein
MDGGYPHEPGWRASAAGDTSKAAALAAKERAPKQADLALAAIRERGRASPEEITEALEAEGHRVLLTSIRARCTQMHKLGVLRPSGFYGKGESGRCRVIQWELAPQNDGGAA